MLEALKPQDDTSFNSQAEGLMLEDMEQAIADMAQRISQATSSAAPESGVINDAMIINELDLADDQALDNMTQKLLLELEDCNSLADLEEVARKFTLKAARLKDRIGQLKTLEDIEEFLSVLHVLKNIQQQIEAMQQDPSIKLNGKLLAQQLQANLNANLQNIRLAAKQAEMASMNMLNSKMAQQLSNLLQSMRSMLDMAQKQGQLTDAQAMQQRLMKMMEQMLKLMQSQQQNANIQQMLRSMVEVMMRNMQTLQQQLMVQRGVQEAAMLAAQRASNTAQMQSTLNQINSINAVMERAAMLRSTMANQQVLDSFIAARENAARQAQMGQQQQQFTSQQAANVMHLGQREAARQQQDQGRQQQEQQVRQQQEQAKDQTRQQDQVKDKTQTQEQVADKVKVQDRVKVADLLQQQIQQQQQGQEVERAAKKFEAQPKPEIKKCCNGEKTCCSPESLAIPPAKIQELHVQAKAGNVARVSSELAASVHAALNQEITVESARVTTSAAKDFLRQFDLQNVQMNSGRATTVGTGVALSA